MVASVALQPPWCPAPGAAAHNNQSHDAQQVYVIKTRGYYCFYYLLAM